MYSSYIAGLTPAVLICINALILGMAAFRHKEYIIVSISITPEV
jgi:hypothetical protein